LSIKTVANFYFIGAVAFFFDAFTYFLAGWIFHLLGWDIAPSVNKILGLIAGLIITYAYNAKITFSSRYSWSSFFRYASTQLFGLIVNLLIFSSLIVFLNDFFALIMATGIASVANYLGARVSFKRNHND